MPYTVGNPNQVDRLVRPTKEQLEAAYKKWAGVDVRDSDAHEPAGINYMVLVTRFVGRGALKSSTFMFTSYQVAFDCQDYWYMRGGLVSLALVKVLHEWGYTQEPEMHGVA